MIPSAWLDLAARRLDGQVHHTPLTYDADLNAYLKWENRQITGSFKIRGALNKVLSLEGWEQQRGLVTASAGNHGQGVAYAARQVGVPVIVFASQHATPAKIEAMRDLGAEVRLVPGGYEEAERTAQVFAAQSGRTWISPYNDAQVIAGQAGVGMEILQQLAAQNLPLPSVVLVPVGGGGLIAGMGAAMQYGAPDCRVIGVQSEASPFFYHLYHNGSQAAAVERESLADGLAGAVEEGAMTIPLVRHLAADLLLVSEEQLARAVAYAWHRHAEKIEGSGAVTLAALFSGIVDANEAEVGPVVAVISGGNIQPEVHARICREFPAPGVQ